MYVTTGVNVVKQQKGVSVMGEMKKKLKRVSSMCYWIDSDGVRHDVVHAGLGGDVTGIWGDATNLWGDATNLWGDVSNLSGNVSNIWGDVTGIWGDATNICGNVSDICGDIDDCDITDDDRAKGVKIADLVEELNNRKG